MPDPRERAIIMSAESVRAEKPKRIQLKRKKGWTMPDNTEIVDRRTPWGNPHLVGLCPLCGIEHPDKADAVTAFRATVADCYDLPLDLIRGKNLACWCKLCAKHRDGKPFGESCPDCEPCHCDPLGEIANRKLEVAHG